MTGLECLREELLKRGCTKAQADSKVIPIILDIVSNSGDQYLQIYNAENELRKTKAETASELRQIRMLRADAESLEAENKKIRCEIAESINDYMRQIEELENRIRQSSETPEGRDAMRKAQMFVDAVTVETKYDNTAFIIGLASILSDGECGAIDTLSKINPKIPPRVKALRSWAKDGWQRI